MYNSENTMFVHSFGHVTADRARLLLFCTQVCSIGYILERSAIF